MHEKITYYCPVCRNDNNGRFWFLIQGYIPDPLIVGHTSCDCCGTPISQLIPTNISWNDYGIIARISTDPAFFEAMMQLKKEDIIEYQSRMSQFRQQVEGQKSTTQSESNTPKCPTCNSTNVRPISGTKRWFSIGAFGLASSNVGKSYECLDCKYKW